MIKAAFEKANELVDRVNACGCRVTIPYAEPSPLTVMFDGSFSGAEFIPSYPPMLHIFGINGHVAVSSISAIKCPDQYRYVVNFGNDSQNMDMMVRILE